MKRNKLLMAALALAVAHSPGWAAKSRLPPEASGGPMVVDLPSPYNFQLVPLNKTVTLTWEWAKPEGLPAFQYFGFEIQRNGQTIARVADQTYTDLTAPWGTHTYKVRVRGGAKAKKKMLEHVSDWSEPASTTLSVKCIQSPIIRLTVAPTQSTYSSVPSLRMRLKGDVRLTEGCTLLKTTYNIDSGTGISNTGKLHVDKQGRFDEYVDALGPQDELPSGRISFQVTATAENESGPTTSDAFTLSMELQNRFAPR